LKKTAAIFLVFLMLFLVAGYHFYFNLQLWQVKKEMKGNIASVNKSSLERFHFSKHEYASLEWQEENEFSFNGNLYDVVEKKVTENSITVICISDKKETALLTAQMHAREDANKNNAVLLKLISIQFIAGETISPEIRVGFTGTEFFEHQSSWNNFHPARQARPPQSC
jgi:hypothetical protein